LIYGVFWILIKFKKVHTEPVFMIYNGPHIEIKNFSPPR